MSAPRQRRTTTVSLRRRVTASTVMVFAGVIVAVMVAVNSAFGVILNRSVTAVLNDHAQLAQQLALEDTPPDELVSRLENRSVRVRLVLESGQVLGNLRAGQTGESGKPRNVQLPNTSGPLKGARLTLEVDARLLSGARSRLLWVLLFTAIAAAVVVGIGVPLVVRYALSPLDTMTRLARDVTHGRRGSRLSAHPTDTELGRTAAAFDDMLDELEGAERRALASEEGMRRFVADAAHELRTPLAGISAAAEAVVQLPEHADAEQRRQLLMMLGREAQRAGRLVGDLLDLARIDTGLSLHPESTNLRALVEDQVERARLLHPELTVSVDGPAVVANVDAGRIAQVVTNLLNNACQVTSADGAVRVAVSRSGTLASVAVSDSGPGVPEGQHEQVFGRMVRLDDRGGAVAGAGLGLPIARGIARAHGGDVTCRPTDGAGAVFVVTVPC